MRRQETGGAGGTPLIGGSSLFVIFAVLCLTVFALRADQSLQQASAEAVTGYYAADQAAEEILAQLRAGKTPEGVTDRGEGRYAYACPISERQTLQVEVQVTGVDYQVLRWQAVSTLDWQADENIEVWNGVSDESTTEGD